MKVHQVSNQPSFGIKIAGKSSWNPKVLEALEKSSLLKEIDAKYPKASAWYFHLNEANYDMVNCENIYTTLFDIFLEPSKRYTWSLSSHNKSVPDEKLVKTLQMLTIEEVEKKAAQKQKPIATINITAVKKDNIFERFYNRIFGHKQ